MIGYDSAGALWPAGGQVYFGYINGSYVTISQARAAAAVVAGGRGRAVSVSVTAGVGAEELDVEAGDATIAEAPAWLSRAVGVRPKIYTSVTNVDALVAAMTAARLPRSAYAVHSAHWTGVMHVCGPATCGATSYACDATQFATNPDYDTSLILPTFFPSLQEVPMSAAIGTGVIVIDGVTTTGHKIAMTCPVARRATGGSWSFMDLTDEAAAQNLATREFES